MNIDSRGRGGCRFVLVLFVISGAGDCVMGGFGRPLLFPLGFRTATLGTIVIVQMGEDVSSPQRTSRGCHVAVEQPARTLQCVYRLTASAALCGAAPLSLSDKL